MSIDTISITDDKNDADRMIGLLDSTLRDAPESDWKIVFGHFPCHSGGHYGGSKEIREKVLPIMKEHKVDMYLAGHDHNLQHWKEAGLFAKGIGKTKVSKELYGKARIQLQITKSFIKFHCRKAEPKNLNPN